MVAEVNGLFVPTAEMVHGRPVYKKEGAEKWIEVYKSDAVTFSWQVKDTANRGKDLCWAYVPMKKSWVPDEASRTGWHEWVSGKWVASELVVSRSNLQAKKYDEVNMSNVS